MVKSKASPDVIDWLMEGDPAIRWQTMRDILGKPAVQWKREQRKVGAEGWGGRLMGLRDPSGTWGGGIYGPKWKSTTYTLLALRDMGLPRGTAAAAEGVGLILDRELGPMEAQKKFAAKLANLDLCVTGMDLALAVYFDLRDDRVEPLVQQILRTQMADGGWNCAQKRRVCTHSSLHTTINILDGLADYAEHRRANVAVVESARRAWEFILQHRLFRSDKTGEVIREEFTRFSFPPRWHWDVLRGLDYFRRVNAPRDGRLQDAIDLMLSKRLPDGRWKLENHHKGREFFRIEKPGAPSRWNTLRAMRILHWWG